MGLIYVNYMSLICFIYSLNTMIPSLKTTVNSFQVMLGGYDLYQLSGMEQFLTLECIIQVHSEILIIYCSIPVLPLFYITYTHIFYTVGACFCSLWLHWKTVLIKLLWI